MYDVTIIGAGPAGISACLYAKRANLNVLVLYYGESNLEKAIQIENYYGFKDGISGVDLYNTGIEQAKKIGVEVKNIEVLGIDYEQDAFNIKTENENLKTKTIILATGNKKIRPNIKGIEKFEGKGISYCAICDAFFYRNKNVAVIGNGKFALNEAEELSHVANKVTIFTNGLDKPESNFEVNTNKISAINGEEKVTGEAGAGDFAKVLGILQDGDNIKINEKMETNVPGIYACGNATGGLLQVCKAVYEGAEAGLSAVNYIRGNK